MQRSLHIQFLTWLEQLYRDLSVLYNAMPHDSLPHDSLLAGEVDGSANICINMVGVFLLVTEFQ